MRMNRSSIANSDRDRQGRVQKAQLISPEAGLVTNKGDTGPEIERVHIQEFVELLIDLP